MRITAIQQLFFTLAVVLTAQTGHSQQLEWANVNEYDINAGNSIGYTAHVHGSDGLYSLGAFEGDIDFNPGAGVFSMTAGTSGSGFITKTNDQGNFIWAKQFDFNAGSANDIALDNDNNIFITGVFIGTVDFDPGTSDFFLTSTGYSDYFILKLDKNGNFLWAKRLGNDQSAGSFPNIDTDKTGNLIFATEISGSMDVDPNAGVFTITNNNYAAFILKLSNSGDFIWAKRLTSDEFIQMISCDFDQDGNVITSGTFTTPVTFDQSSGPYVLTSTDINQFTQLFIQKSDPLGNILWVKQLGALIAPPPIVSVQDNGNILITATIADAIDVDPGTGVHFIGTQSIVSCFAEQLDSNGDFKSVSNLPELNFNPGFKGQDGFIYLPFSRNEGSPSVDINPGPGVNMTDSGKPLNGIIKLNEDGDFAQSMLFYGESGHSSTGGPLCLDSANTIFFSGNHFDGTLDLDPSVNQHPYNAANGASYIVKLKQRDCNDLVLTIDEADPSCTSTGTLAIHPENGSTPYTYNWINQPANTDSIATIIISGVYTVSVTDYAGCRDSVSVLMGGSETNADLNVSLIGAEFTPGYITEVSLDGFNQGCTPADGKLTCIIDPQTTASDFDPTPDNISGDTISWDFSALTYESEHMLPKFNLLTSTGAQIGDSIHLMVSMTKQAGDPDSTNNFRSYLFPVVNGFDPNHKSVYPAGECTPHLISNDQRLTYTVQFQNTGNADAISIAVVDPLDSNLDITTLRVTGSSDTMWTEVLPGNVVKFHFDNIYLADSTSNEQESHGYVVFSVAPVTGITAGATITNNVGIYFDFNPPIYTNEVFNTISDGNNHTSSTLTATGIDQYTLNGTTYTQSGTFTQVVPNMYGCDSTITLHLSLSFAGLTDLSNSEINVFPNPFNEQLSVTLSNEEPAVITLTDLQGKTVIPAFTTTNTLTLLPTKELAGGVYFLKVSQQGTERRVKIVKN